MPTITDWLMVIITLVYVVATVFICIANIKSAKAAREQTEEIVFINKSTKRFSRNSLFEKNVLDVKV